jgi:tetratricopeptide (TPR) repeat protein
MGLNVKADVGGRLALLLCSVSLAGCAGGEMASKLSQQQQLVRSEQGNNIASLSEVIKNNPTDPNALNLRGAAYGQAGENEKALADFNAALAINPQYSQAYANRALIYVRAKRIPQAIADYDQAINIDPNYAPAYVGRGHAHRSMNNHAMAIP